MIDVPIGGGHVAKIVEPTRDKFAGNLGGAIEYSLAHLVYKILEIMGGGLGTFLGGAAVQFLETVEPSLVEYARPLIDMILEAPDLPVHLREFFTLLRDPTHEGAATILQGLSSQAGGAVANTFISAALKPLTNWLNAAVRGSVPSVTELWAMNWRGLITSERVNQFMGMNGYFDYLGNAYQELARPRAGVADLLSAFYRGTMAWDDVTGELHSRGFTNEDINVFAANSEQLMDFDTMLSAVFLGELGFDELRTIMKKQGWNDMDITTMINTKRPMPQVGDLIRFGLREAYDDGVAARWGYDDDFPANFTADMAKLGFDPIWARRFWRAHWELPSVTLGQDMTHRGIISPGQFNELLRIQDYPSGWRDKIQQVLYANYTRVDIRRMYGMGILTRDQVKRAYLDIGYNEERAENLTEFAIRYEDEDGNSTKGKYKDLTQGIISSAVQKGMMDDGQAQTELEALEFAPEDAALIIRLAHWKKAVEDKPEPIPEFNKDVKAITERAYMMGIVDQETAMATLAEVGYSVEESDYILKSIDMARANADTEDAINLVQQAYLNGAIERTQAIIELNNLNLPATQQEQLLDKWDVTLSLPSRRLSEAQYRAAFKAKIIDQDAYRQAMVDLGYSMGDVDILVQLYTGGEGETEVEQP